MKEESSNPKLLLASDIIAFLSIISAFLFLSLTLHFNLFETLLGLTLENINQLTTFYIMYAILIVLLKVIAAISNLIKKDASKFSQLLNDTVGSSLFSVFLVLTFTLGINVEINVMCQVIAWLFVAELNLIFCGLLKEYQIVDSLRLFGLTIETILIVGQLLRITGIDFFDFL